MSRTFCRFSVRFCRGIFCHGGHLGLRRINTQLGADAWPVRRVQPPSDDIASTISRPRPSRRRRSARIAGAFDEPPSVTLSQTPPPAAARTRTTPPCSGSACRTAFADQCRRRSTSRRTPLCSPGPRRGVQPCGDPGAARPMRHDAHLPARRSQHRHASNLPESASARATDLRHRSSPVPWRTTPTLLALDDARTGQPEFPRRRTVLWSPRSSFQTRSNARRLARLMPDPVGHPNHTVCGPPPRSRRRVPGLRVRTALVTISGTRWLCPPVPAAFVIARNVESDPVRRSAPSRTAPPQCSIPRMVPCRHRPAGRVAAVGQRSTRRSSRRAGHHEHRLPRPPRPAPPMLDERVAYPRLTVTACATRAGDR